MMSILIRSHVISWHSLFLKIGVALAKKVRLGKVVAGKRRSAAHVCVVHNPTPLLPSSPHSYALFLLPHLPPLLSSSPFPLLSCPRLTSCSSAVEDWE